MRILRLILGDQLNREHSWYQEDSQQVLYVMMEVRQETDYVKHHIQKIVGLFAAMRSFRDWLKEKGCTIEYYTINDPGNTQSITENLLELIEKHNIEKFEYQLPDEFRLDQQLKAFCDTLDISSKSYDSEHFLTARDDLEEFFQGKKQMVMEYFYRMMRKKYHIMVDEQGNPEGEKWNYDQANRSKWKGEPRTPASFLQPQDVQEIYDEIQDAGVDSMGSIVAESFQWPTTPEACKSALNGFCKESLPHFGTYQDAMHDGEPFLFHSLLSFGLNTKMIHPLEVIHTVIEHWRANSEEISIEQVEGFVRQIIGWREYMRGIYWAKMPEYEQLNFFEHKYPLPNFYWTGDTKMNCLKHCISQSLEYGYAHHIQRLMVTGNFALLTQCDPDEVDAWYLGIYVDAYQWVEITNTRGMSQFADGGIVATKPYISSANYINKMSNYCQSCHYNKSKRYGDKACPFNTLYWNFLLHHDSKLRDNPRMSMMMRLVDKMDEKEKSRIMEYAEELLTERDQL